MNFDTSNFSVGLNNNLPNSGVLGMLPVFDPCAMLLKRIADKNNMEQQQNIVVEPYNDEAVKELETFCKKHNIMGFNFGKMSPSSALRMLKGKMGIVEQPNQVSTKQLLKG